MALYDLSSQLDPVRFAKRYLHLDLDAWQAEAAHPKHRRLVLNCCRQSGKTTTAAVNVVHHALFTENADVLVVSATEIQAGENMRRIADLYHQLGEPTRRLKGRRYDFEVISTGARIRALPCRESAVRGYTATFVLIDEAALVGDAVYQAIIGTLATTWDKARMMIVSTPREARGFFFMLFTGAEGDGWHRIEVTIDQCCRISPAFKEEQRRKLPDWRYKQEYECQFGDTGAAVFPAADLLAAQNDRHAPALSPHRIEFVGTPKCRFQMGLDHGQTNDHPALTILQHRPVYEGDQIHGRLVVRYLQRLPLGIQYPDLIAYLRQLLTYPELQRNGVDLVFDATAANVLTDYLRNNKLGVHLVPVVITSGTEVTQSNGKYHVPKNELFHDLQFLFRNRNLKIAKDAGHVEEFISELAGIRRLVNIQGYEQFITRAGEPDDMVSSATLAAWWALRQHKHSLLKDVA